MSLWKKIGLALAAAVTVLIVALAVLVLVPGGWKFSLVLAPAVGGPVGSRPTSARSGRGVGAVTRTGDVLFE
ncbi:hypothetical protein AB0B45_37595 [Nonomuraea sp. NPDC049152]|uniref:hypothetical protein n=1 Tax=Nonomuraea sp. NPDC049152 TaxID=3154350 RepID=UPI0033D3B228